MGDWLYIHSKQYVASIGKVTILHDCLRGRCSCHMIPHELAIPITLILMKY